MIIDVRGKTDEETYRNGVLAMAALGYTPIRVVCEGCGEDAYVFRDFLIDKDGYYTGKCSACGGGSDLLPLTSSAAFLCIPFIRPPHPERDPQA